MQANWILRVYDEQNVLVYQSTFFASTHVTADKMALNEVERDFPGMDWSLMPYPEQES